MTIIDLTFFIQNLANISGSFKREIIQYRSITCVYYYLLEHFFFNALSNAFLKKKKYIYIFTILYEEHIN